jgi:hypothetical protein
MVWQTAPRAGAPESAMTSPNEPALAARGANGAPTALLPYGPPLRRKRTQVKEEVHGAYARTKGDPLRFRCPQEGIAMATAEVPSEWRSSPVT